MADALIYTLLTTLETAIKANPGIAPGNVALGRLETLTEEQLPYVAIFLNDDVSLGDNGANNTNFIDWNVSVNIELTVTALSTESLDKAYLDLRALVHNSIMEDETLGLNFCLFAVPEGSDEPALTDDPERRLAVYRTSWIFRIRTSVKDITTL